MVCYGPNRPIFSLDLVWNFIMLSWAVIFLIVGLVAGVLGLSGIAGAATQIAWILFVVGIVVAIVLFITGRRGPT